MMTGKNVKGGSQSMTTSLIALPLEFQFSQSALQDYTDCHRRFYLRYVKGQRYPAAESDPVIEFETRMEQGTRFHDLVHQHSIGIPAALIRAALTVANQDVLLGWFDAYLDAGLRDLPPVRHAEMTLTIPLAGRRLLAKYDLIALVPGERAVIVDWKTAPKRPTRADLATRWQTIVYPHVLTLAGAHLNNGVPFTPEQITMIYWFPATPSQPEIFHHDAAQDASAADRLNAITAEILARPNDENAFPLTPDESRCRFCTYRSYCDRGSQAGNALTVSAIETTDPLAFDLDFDQIDAISF